MKTNLAQAFESIKKPWTPKIVGELNEQHVKIATFEGEFIWHQHDHEDEMFLVVDGAIEIHLRDRVIKLERGEFYIVPRGVEHKPVAHARASVLMFEPKTTRNTGTTDHALTIESSDLDEV
ncbi:MAG: cupin domain-containing protein [Planctomycetota bacterium]